MLRGQGYCVLAIVTVIISCSIDLGYCQEIEIKGPVAVQGDLALQGVKTGIAFPDGTRQITASNSSQALCCGKVFSVFTMIPASETQEDKELLLKTVSNDKTAIVTDLLFNAPKSLDYNGINLWLFENDIAKVRINIQGSGATVPNLTKVNLGSGIPFGPGSNIKLLYNAYNNGERSIFLSGYEIEN